MDSNSLEISFPAQRILSFRPLIETLEQRLDLLGVEEKRYLQGLLERAAVLTEEGSDGLPTSVLSEHEDLVQELLRQVAPIALGDNEIKYVSRPWDFNVLTASPRFQRIMDKSGVERVFDLDLKGGNDMYIAGCATILGMYYGMATPNYKSIYIDLPDTTTGRMHAYRLAINADFLRVRPTDKAVEITQDDYHELMDNFGDAELWLSKFPENSWEFSGFTVMNMMDVSRDRLLSRLTHNLLEQNINGLTVLQEDLSELLGHPIRISFINLEGGSLIQKTFSNLQPLMMGEKDTAICRDLMCAWVYGELIEHDRDIALPDVDRHAERSGSRMGANLKAAGVKSYFASPVIYNGERLGYLELGSEVKGALNSSMTHQLAEVMPILAVAGNRLKQEHENRLEALIQAECTTIHPSVKWRFVEEADRHLQAVDNGEEHRFSDIVFKDVYPLFGQLDIRNSSVIRNEGVKKDLQTQLRKARGLFETAHEDRPMPFYEEAIHAIDSYDRGLETKWVSSSEQEILQFFKKELHPVMEHLSSRSDCLSKAYQEYQDILHPDLHFVYQERAAFDSSVNEANRIFSTHMDRQQLAAQEVFPHHFERYATDGLEFNMYVGESIAPGRGFHMMMVKNLRLWQLMVIVEMEREYHEFKKTVEKPLSVAALVLAYSNSLSIEYRMDEKRFDVEGAYNARYEIIKKRIDKAHIKGTAERITEVGKLVTVYSQDEDEREYQRYYSFLTSKGYLGGQAEIVQLEELQGVSGLKAIRQDIVYDASAPKAELSMEEIMAEIEGKG